MLWALSNLWAAFAWFIHSTWKLPMPNDGTARGCIFVSLWMNQSILISSFCCLLYVVFIPYGRHCCLCDDFSNLHPRWSNLCASSMQYVTETPTGHWPVHVQPTSIDDRNTLLGQAIDDCLANNYCDEEYYDRIRVLLLACLNQSINHNICCAFINLPSFMSWENRLRVVVVGSGFPPGRDRHTQHTADRWQNYWHEVS